MSDKKKNPEDVILSNLLELNCKVGKLTEDVKWLKRIIIVLFGFALFKEIAPFVLPLL